MRAALAVLTFVLAGSCYHLPIWKGDVSVTPRARASIETCGDGAVTPAGSYVVTREPYLQSTTTSSTTVVWGTMATRNHVVLTEPDGDVVATVNAAYTGEPERRARRELAQVRTEGKRIKVDDIYLVAAEVTGLQAGQLYCYQLFSGTTALTRPAPLATAAAPSLDGSVHFVALGDSGTGGDAQRAIGKWIAAQPFDLMLFLGDIAYEKGTAAQLHHNFFVPYKDLLRYVPAFPSIGNHERHTRRGGPYFEAFVLPGAERYYSFDWGNVHFVAIDTTQRDAKQLAWLDDDLARTKQPWTIVFGHHPMYTNSLRGPQKAIRRAFAKIFTDHQVDLVLTGHEHHYERFKIAGVNYIVSGGGGAQLTRFFGDSQALAQFTLHHFLAFEVSAHKLTMRVVDIQGRDLETLELSKKPSGAEKTKVNDKPDERSNDVAPEKTIESDEELHDEPDDDQHKHPATPAEPVTEPPTTTAPASPLAPTR